MNKLTPEMIPLVEGCYDKSKLSEYSAAYSVLCSLTEGFNILGPHFLLFRNHVRIWAFRALDMAEAEGIPIRPYFDADTAKYRITLQDIIRRISVGDSISDYELNLALEFYTNMVNCIEGLPEFHLAWRPLWERMEMLRGFMNARKLK